MQWGSRVCKYTLPLLVIIITAACALPKNFGKEFFSQHEKELRLLIHNYKKLNNQQPFYISFRDKHFTEIEFVIIEPARRLHYNFDIGTTHFTDTLTKYKFNTSEIIQLLHRMQQVKCTWLASQDYYERMQKKELIVLAIRNSRLDRRFKNERYCTYAVFDDPQPFDQRGRLLDKEDKTRNRELSGNIYYKVTDRIAATITMQYK